MGHRPIEQKNGPLITEIAILNLERMAHWKFKFFGNKWKMAHTIVCPAITLHLPMHFFLAPPTTTFQFLYAIEYLF